MNPRTKLILIIREPITRLLSDFRHQQSLGRILVNQTLEQALMTSKSPQATIDMTSQSINQSADILQASLYAEHLTQWHTYFPWEQIHIVDGDNIKRNPLQELQQLETYLGLEHVISESNFIYNESKGFYCFHRTSRKWCLPEQWGNMGYSINAETLTMLNYYMEPINNKLYSMINRTFGWENIVGQLTVN